MTTEPAPPDATTEQTAALLDLLPKENLRPFGNAQCFHPEHRLLYYTLTGLERNGASQAVIVRSDGKLLRYSVDAIQREGFCLPPTSVDPKTQELIPPSVLARWSHGSLKAFTEAPTSQRTAAEVYQSIIEYLQRFIYHDDPRALSLLVLFTMASYV